MYVGTRTSVCTHTVAASPLFEVLLMGCQCPATWKEPQALWCVLPTRVCEQNERRRLVWCCSACAEGVDVPRGSTDGQDAWLALVPTSPARAVYKREQHRAAPLRQVGAGCCSCSLQFCFPKSLLRPTLCGVCYIPAHGHVSCVLSAAAAGSEPWSCLSPCSSVLDLADKPGSC